MGSLSHHSLAGTVVSPGMSSSPIQIPNPLIIPDSSSSLVPSTGHSPTPKTRQHHPQLSSRYQVHNYLQMIQLKLFLLLLHALRLYSLWKPSTPQLYPILELLLALKLDIPDLVNS
ncbi:Hypothetical predicted protein [Olea europaea subsp. europaea]|uniref:Uncharacterized protein n=1 Tax=Olea europaea subsp. europaea TaxID=158383 RepID=A0A8S0PJV4_OLEEU|nr:Hypothetical predicted protein [Olea europaea subsp. europaea]